MKWESANVRRETPSGAQRHTNPSPLATFNGPPRWAWRPVSLNISPARRAGGAGPAGSGRGLSCTCRSGRSCWTAAPPWPFGPRSTRWAEAPEPAARSTALPMRRGCAGCTGPGPAGGVRTGGQGKGAPTPPALPTSLRLISPG